MHLSTRRLSNMVARVSLALLIVGLVGLSVGARAAEQYRIYVPLVMAPTVAAAVPSATPVTATPVTATPVTATPVTATPVTATPVTVTPTATPTATSTCPTAAFLSVKSANSNYPDPVLNVSCANGKLVVVSNGIPNFAFVKKTPNDLVAQSYTWSIPLSPVAASATTALSLGAVGVAVNGLPIYGPMEAPAQGSADPLLDGILDTCNGHTGPRGEYHLHARPDCIFTKVDGQVGLVIGYAFDGYPILAPYLCVDSACSSTRELKSSYQKTSDARDAWVANTYVAGAGDLDQCNGRTGSDGSYRYYATTTFPYFIGCFHGQVSATVSSGAGAAGDSVGDGLFICHQPRALAPVGRRG